jgi:cytochrome c-type biogenesis protein CcsB
MAAASKDKRLPPLALELFYYSHQPFRNAAVFYLFSAMFFTAALLLARQSLAWVGLGLLGVGFIEHVLGLSIRWILAERGPFSNMYESFVFAIGGMIFVALILEGSRMVRLAGLGASILGFIFMVIAHKAPIFDSQIRPLVPALQSSWLTYHVVTIMLSYSAFALSFFVSVLYLVKDGILGGDSGTNLLARRLPSLHTLDVFNYRIIAIGFPLLTLGIVIGAIWAATAWGRPWGFDPKETWSAITWLIYAVYLHIRFMAGWGGRAFAVISIIGFAAVLFTYFGVNYLLPGLHSYV